MEVHLFWIAVAVTLTSLAWQGSTQTGLEEMAPFRFECGRKGVECFGDDSTCDSPGVCRCGKGRSGNDCRLTDDLKESSAPECQTMCVGGRCMVGSDDSIQCICSDTEVHMGNSCQQRALVNCTVDALTFTVFPHVGAGTFSGTLIAVGVNTSEACSPVPADSIVDVQASVDPTSEAGKSITIPFTNCGGAVVTTLENNATRMSFQIVVAYSENIQTVLDEIYDARCVLPASGSELQVEPMVTTVNGSVQPETPLQTTPDLVTLEVGISDPLRIGDDINFTYKLAEQETYVDFQLVDLKASSQESSGFLVQGGCVLNEPLVDVVLTPSRSPFEIGITYKAFKFHDSTDVVYNSTLRVCREICTTPECPNGSPLEQGGPDDTLVVESRRRRRRDTRDNDNVMEHFTTTLRVESPFDRNNDDPTGSVRKTFTSDGLRSDEDCTRSIVLLILAIVLAVLLVVVTASCLFFCVRSRSGHDVIHCGARPTSGLENPVYGRDYKR